MNNIDIDQILSEVEQEVTKAFAKSEEEVQEEVENTETEEVVEMNKNESEEIEEEILPYSEQDLETIESIYSEMSKSEMEAHYNSIKKALFGESAQESMEKSEETETEKENDEVSLMKSEMETVKAENESLKKSLQEFFDSLNKKAPERKAVTNVGYIAKSEESTEKNIDLSKLTKGEITGKLKGLDYSSLSKSDRDAINDYYLNSGSVEKIKHLILE